MADLLTKNATTTEKGVVQLATDDETTANVVVQGNDARLNPVRKDYAWLVGQHLVVEEDSNFMATMGMTDYYGGNFTPAGVVASTSASADGSYAILTTGAVSGDTKGMTFHYRTATNGLCKRKFYPRVFVKFQLVQTATTRLFIGFHSSTNAYPATTFPTGDDSLNAKSGFGLYVTSGGNFRIGYNDGTGATVFSSDLATIDTNVHTIYLEADDANSRWGYSFDNGTLTYLTTDIPAQTTLLGGFYNIETAAAAAKSLRLYSLNYAVRSN